MTEYLSTSEAAKKARRNTRYISSLVKAGVIAGRKIGPVWLVDGDSLQKYIEQEHKPGPKPKEAAQVNA